VGGLPGKKEVKKATGNLKGVFLPKTSPPIWLGGGSKGGQANGLKANGKKKPHYFKGARLGKQVFNEGDKNQGKMGDASAGKEHSGVKSQGGSKTKWKNPPRGEISYG